MRERLGEYYMTLQQISEESLVEATVLAAFAAWSSRRLNLVRV
jgi:hypothetical protein